MNEIKIIKPYKKRPNSMLTLEGSLMKEGFSRAPGTIFGVLPEQDAKGHMITGIDENAIQIRLIKDPEARELEMARVKAIREELELAVNEDLSVTSAFWNDKLTEPFKLKDGDNVFDLRNPWQAIDYYWITQLPIVAKSLADIQSGKVDDSYIKWYVYESNIEHENEFNRKKQINDVVATLNKLDEVQIRKVAFILNLKLPEKASYQDIYNQLDDFIKTPKTYGSHDPIEEFKKATSYTPEILAIKVLVKQLLEERILKQKGNAVFEGENLIAKSIEDLEVKLAEDQELYIAYDLKSKAKKEYANNI